MLIDWFTVGAEALNFLLLVWLMQHFLYRPVLHAIDAREQLVAKLVDDARAKDASAQQRQDELNRQLAELEKQRSTLLAKATGDATAEGERLAEGARQVATSLASKQGEDLRRQATDLEQSVAHQTVREVFEIARRALVDLADVSLDDRMGAVFSQRLRTMDGAAKTALGQLLRTSVEPALVRTAFETNAAQRESIQNAVNEAFSAEVRLRFEAAPDLVNGIELTSGGQRAGWNISSYLGSLEQEVNTLLTPGDAAKANGAHAPRA